MPVSGPSHDQLKAPVAAPVVEHARGRRARNIGVLAVIAVVAGVVAAGIVVLTRHDGSGTAAPVTRHSSSSSPAPTTTAGSAAGSVAVPAGYPDGATTGVPSGSKLTTYSGPLMITKSGAVIDHALVDGCLFVKASHVTITDSKIVCTGSAVLRIGGTASGVVLDRDELDGGGSAPVGLEGKNFTATGLNIHGTGDGVHLGRASTLQDSYVHDLADQPGLHHDDLQTPKGSTASGILIRHNTLQVISAHFNGNSAYHLGSGAISNVQVIDNYIDGGNYTIQIDNNPTQRDIVFRDNHFGRHYRFGIITVPGSTGAVSFVGNVWQDDGKPVNEQAAAAAARATRSPGMVSPSHS